MANFNLDNESITIPISKYKIVGLFLMSAAIAAVGVLALLNAKAMANTEYHRRPVFLVIIVGIICAAVGVVACILSAYRLLLSSKPGLIVDLNGIFDNSTPASLGLVKWNEITDIRESDQAGYINIFVKNPREFIDRSRNGLTKRIIQAAFKKSGTPIIISDSSLRCDYNELSTLLSTRLFEYQQAREHTLFDGTL